MGFEIGQTPFDEIEEINFGSAGYSCGTGDSFVTRTPKLRTDSLIWKHMPSPKFAI